MGFLFDLKRNLLWNTSLVLVFFWQKKCTFFEEKISKSVEQDLCFIINFSLNRKEIPWNYKL
jgi:hypothetical protein